MAFAYVSYIDNNRFPQPALFGRGVETPRGHIPDPGYASFRVDLTTLDHAPIDGVYIVLANFTLELDPSGLQAEFDAYKRKLIKDGAGFQIRLLQGLVAGYSPEVRETWPSQMFESWLVLEQNVTDTNFIPFISSMATRLSETNLEVATRINAKVIAFADPAGTGQALSEIYISTVESATFDPANPQQSYDDLDAAVQAIKDEAEALVP